MATNTINTRIRLKYDTLSNWNSSNFVPLQGEVCIAEIPNVYTIQTTDGQPTNTPPAIGIKVGTGNKTFAQLPWIQAIAGDVYAWAKAATKPSYDASEIQNLSSYISGQINDTDTQYQIVAGTGANENKYYLQSKGLSESSWTTVSTIDLSSLVSRVSDLETKVGDSSVATQISSAIGALGAAAQKDVDTTIVDGVPSSKLPTTDAVVNYIDSKTSGLTGAMHFKGVSSTAITDGGTQNPTINNSVVSTKNSGDVVLYNSQEFVWTGSAWELLGDESSYALKTISVTGGDGLSGGGTLTEDRTITHATPSGAISGAKGGTSGTRTYIQSITTDKFGHITGTTSATETVTDTTYTFNEGVNNGTFLVTPAGGSSQSVTVHGLGDAAFVDIDSTITSSASNIPSTAAVYNAINTLDSSLHTIAHSGSIYDVEESNTVTESSNTVHYLVFNCGSASTLITDA